MSTNDLFVPRISNAIDNAVGDYRERLPNTVEDTHTRKNVIFIIIYISAVKFKAKT